MKRIKSQSGATQAEYLFLVALIAIALVTGVSQFGDGINSSIESSTETIEEKLEN